MEGSLQSNLGAEGLIRLSKWLDGMGLVRRGLLMVHWGHFLLKDVLFLLG